MSEKSFYLVWSPRGGPPKKRHFTHAAAKEEAVQLCHSNPGCEFFVLQSLSVTRAVDVKTIDLLYEDEVV